MKKMLFISNIALKVGTFSIASVHAAQECGYKFYYAANWSNSTKEQIKVDEENHNVKIVHFDLERSPFSYKNYKVYKEMIKFVNEEGIDYIHCNTPVGGLLGRLVGKKCKTKKVVYQAHGFHCYKGAPLFNRTVLKWAEQLMAHWTDAVITMNQEDYEFAKSLKLRKGGKAYLVHGVGINTEDFFNVEVDTSAKRDELGLKADDIILISMGDLIPRKNYSVAIKAVAEAKNDKLHYLICGRGPQLDNLKALANELGVENQIHFLGFRTDIKELAKTSDIFLFTTKQEGMPRSMMEAMACGLPCIASKIRGNVDIIEDGVNGYLCDTMDYVSFAEKINVLSSDEDLRKEISKANIEKIKEYDVSVVEEEIGNIYRDILG